MGQLVITRRPMDGTHSVIQIGEGPDAVEIEILEVRSGQQVRVGINAPAHVPIFRRELVTEGRTDKAVARAKMAENGA